MYRAKIEDTKQYTTQYKTVVEDEKPRLEASELLPGYMQKLTGGYEFRTYWFELFETTRKVCRRTFHRSCVCGRRVHGRCECLDRLRPRAGSDSCLLEGLCCKTFILVGMCVLDGMCIRCC